MAQIGDDCFFFYNAGCHRGIHCKFRHQPAATLTTETCPEWLKGSCTNPACILRHAVIDNGTSKRNNSMIPCKFELSTGCLNQNCPFMHKVPKAAAPPVTQSNTDVLPVATLPLKMESNSVSMNGFPSTLPTNVVAVNKPISVPLPPQLTPRIVPALHSGVVGNSSLPLNLIHPSIQQAQVTTLGAQVTAFPKNEHFSEQVRLFKEMLAAREKEQRVKIRLEEKGSWKDCREGEERAFPERVKWFDQQGKELGGGSQGTYSDENDDDETYRRSKHKSKDRQKSKKSRRNRDGTKHKNSYKKFTEKASYSKDEEFLYDGYKDDKFEQKSKRRSDKYASSDSEVTIKTYEEILREKALRKLIERRKDKFEAEFDSLMERDKSSSKKSRKRSKSVDSTDQESHENNSKKRTKSIDADAFTEEDAVELGLDASPIREDFDEPVGKQSKKDNVVQSPDKSENRSDPSPKDTGAVVIIPDETTDINFSVDADDDLALELNQTEETACTDRRKNVKSTNVKSKTISKPTEKTSSKTNNSIKSKVTSSSKNTNRSSNSSSKKSDKDSAKVVRQGVTSVVSVISKPTKKTLEEISSSSKRKVISLASDSTDTASVPNETTTKCPILFPAKNELVNKTDKLEIKTDKPVNKSKLIKVKSFNEIMAEKRKRKLGEDKTCVISDDTNSSVSEDNSENTEKRNVNNSLAVRNLKRNTGDEEKAKRKTVQLYKPPVASEPSVDSQNLTGTKQRVVNLSPKKVVLLQKESVSTDKNAGTSVKSTLPTKPLGGVMSFEEIMRAKRLRRQKEQEKALSGKQGNIGEVPVANPKKVSPLNRKPILRRHSSSNKVDGQSEKREEKIDQSKIARVPPLQQVAPGSLATADLSTTQSQPEEHTTELLDSMSSSKKPLAPNLVDIPPLSHNPDNASSQSEQQLNVVKPLTDEIADSPHSMDEIREALDNDKRKKESDLLSDDEFEKEINDLYSGDDDENDELSDIDDNDLMMELEQMIDS